MAVYCEHPIHGPAIVAAEGVKQAALVGATQAQANAAHIVYQRTLLASARVNNLPNAIAEAVTALQALGTGGT